MTPTATDEGRHPPGDDPGWEEAWTFDWVDTSGSWGGVVGLALCPGGGAARFEAAVVGDGRTLVSVVDQEVPSPRPPGLDVRSEGLWAALQCETPLEHWSLGLEAFGLALDDPDDAWGSPVVGERTALGLDVEWETADAAIEVPGGYAFPCTVYGEVLVGREALALDGWGWRSHIWGLANPGPPPSVRGRWDDGAWEPDGGPSAAVHHRAPLRIDAADGRVVLVDRALCPLTGPSGRAGTAWREALSWQRPAPAPRTGSVGARGGTRPGGRGPAAPRPGLA